MITITHKGDFSKAKNYLNNLKKASRVNILEQYGEQGLAALASVTPVDTSLTANSWYYEVKRGVGTTSITFYNSHVNKGVNIAIILQYGHGTRNGGYVVGRDYINPAIQPIFDKIADAAWKEVTKL